MLPNIMTPDTVTPAAKQMSPAQQMPLVSIVIPVYNRAELIQPCLASLISQTYPRDRYEIILVDDGSTDDTVERAQASVQVWPGQFRLVQKANGGPASARNAGFRASAADVIAFIDSIVWLRYTG